MKTKNIYIGVVAALLMVSCGTHKTAVQDKSVPVATKENVGTAAASKQKLQFAQKVADQALYQKNLVSDLSFTVNTGSREITVPGILHLRKDEVIRLQLLIPLLRSEVGRIEFTKDYVLFIDRMHKQYVKASYNDVSFLKDNGINFYSLQSLFWNQLFIPGKQKVGENGLAEFDVDLTKMQTGGKTPVPLTLKDGKMEYKWLAEAVTGLISMAEAKYTSASHGVSTLNWNYRDFKKFGARQFPATHEVVIVTPAAGTKKTLKATFELDSFSDKADWESFTTPSDKYKQVGVEEILGKLMKL